MGLNRLSGGRLREGRFANCKYFLILWTFVGINMIVLYHIEPFSYFDSSSSVKSPPEDGVMTAMSLGRLGNNMLEYATLYALSRVNRCLALMSPDMKSYLSPCFLVSMPSNWTLDRYANWRTVTLPHLAKDNYKNISCHGDFIRLSGYPSDWRYFVDFDQSIRREFTFSSDVGAMAEDFLRVAGSAASPNKKVTYVGMHVRRTDYSAYLERQDCGIADRRYFVAAMQYFTSKYKNVVFVIASDDPDEVAESLNGSGFWMVFVGKRYSPCTSLAILAQCNHSIITQGTFGFWAAYLAGGETVYYTDYCHGNSDLLPKFRGLHLDHWVGISATKL